MERRTPPPTLRSNEADRDAKGQARLGLEHRSGQGADEAMKSMKEAERERAMWRRVTRVAGLDHDGAGRPD